MRALSGVSVGEGYTPCAVKLGPAPFGVVPAELLVISLLGCQGTRSGSVQNIPVPPSMTSDPLMTTAADFTTDLSSQMVTKQPYSVHPIILQVRRI